MSSPLGERYLRILTPQTSNGVNIIYDEKGKIVYKETHLPLTAEKAIRRKNKNLPAHLQHTIEFVEPEAKKKIAEKPVKPEPPKKVVKVEDDKKEIDDEL